MSLFEDIWSVLSGDTIATTDLANGFNASEAEVEARMRNLVENGVFREVFPGRQYEAADDVDTKEMVREFRSEFSDLQDGHGKPELQGWLYPAF